MRHPTKAKLKKFLAAALLLGLAAAALVVFPGLVGQGRQVVSQPFLRLFSAGHHILRQLSAYSQGIQRLEEENQALTQEIASLTAQAQLGKLARGENARLRALLDLKSRSPDLTLTDAWVVGSFGASGTAALDRGTEEGIQPGQWVIDAAGDLVGRVTDSGSGWSTLTLLTSPDFSLIGQGVDTETLGQVTGVWGGRLRFTPLGEDRRPALGETVVTVSLSGSCPTGLLLGTVSAHKKDTGGLTTWAELTPAADLSDLGQVFVVLAFGEGTT